MARCETCGAEIKDGRRFCSWSKGKDRPGCADAWFRHRAEVFAQAGAPPDGVTYGKREGKS